MAIVKQEFVMSLFPQKPTVLSNGKIVCFEVEYKYARCYLSHLLESTVKSLKTKVLRS